ncbi:hypothetical protein MMC21_001414 [Puttea exsequens]|nr:hypothetical protein [Puttea exsequens]
MGSPSPLDPLDPNTPSRQPNAGSPSTDKPLPAPLVAPDSTQVGGAAPGTTSAAAETSSHIPRPSLSGASSFQRPKKRVIWRNRGIIIALPIDTDFGKRTSRESYLTPDDVAQRLEAWEAKGYNTNGFVLALEAKDVQLLSQSRAIHPSQDDEKRERANRNYKISIPDKQEWEAYVNRLKEEKLRALGVSFGDEEPPRRSPAPSLMSRQASSQSSAMVTSPALAPQPGYGMSFPSTVHPGNAGVSHFPRYSMAMPFGEKPFSPPHQFPRPSQSPVARNWSPQHFLGSQPGSRVASPMTNGYVKGPDGAMTPVSPPLPSGVGQVPNQTTNDLMARMRHQQALVQVQQVQQGHQQQQLLQARSDFNHQRPQIRERKPMPIPDGSSPEIASPMPRGHCQNLSETLQKEVDEQGSGQQKSFSNAGNHGKPSAESKPINGGRDTSADDGNTIARLAKVDVSDLDTNPSLTGTPDRQQSSDGLAYKHSAKPSLTSNSKLNVNAPEFKLEPKESFDPRIFAFTGNQHVHLGPTNEADLAAPVSAQSLQETSKLNVAAPAFTPRAAAKSSVPSGRVDFMASNIPNKPTDPSREFSFSSSGPSFNPDAPAFKPSDSEAAASINSLEKGNPVDAVQKIFGDIKYSDVIKPVKRSTAAPIVDPIEGSESVDKSGTETDGQEDESGRITQADGRQKRLRRGRDDGDDAPSFASPNQARLVDNGGDDRAAYFSRTPSPKPDEATVEAATDLLEELIDNLSVIEASDIMREDESIELDAAGEKSLAPEDIAEATVQFLGKSSQFQGEFGNALGRESPNSSTYIDASLAHEHANRIQREDGIDRIDHARQDILDGVRYVEPTYDEIDVVVKHMGEDSDLGVDREPNPSRRRNQSPSLDHGGYRRLLLPSHPRSDAPSPSPNRLRGTFQYQPAIDSASVDSSIVDMVSRNAQYSPSYRPNNISPVHKLNSPGSTPPSDWDDAISSLDEPKFRSRTGFFDNRVNDLVGEVVQQHLGPLEKTLSGIQQSLTLLSSTSTSRRPRSSGTIGIENSDADDEDDIDAPPSSRVKSPLRDRRNDQLKVSHKDGSAAQQLFVPASQLTDVLEAVKELKESVSHRAQTQVEPPAPLSDKNATPATDIKAIVKEAVDKQFRGKSDVVASSSQAALVEKNNLKIAGLESMLKIAENRAHEEMQARRSIEDALADSQRLLRGAMQDAAEQREAAEATERSLQDYHEERHNQLTHTAILEGAKENLEKMASDLSDKNAALEDTLAEYRLSSDQWRTEISDVKHENKDLRRANDILKAENQEHLQAAYSLRNQFNGLQEDMSRTSQDMAQDQFRWRSKEEELLSKLDMLGARLEAEARTRERLAFEIQRLEAQEKESVKARFMVEQTQNANIQLEDMVASLRAENHENQKVAARFERELHDTKEIAKMEAHRTRTIIETDLEAAKKQADVVRAEFGSVTARLQSQLEDVTDDLNKTKSRHDLILQEASDHRRVALREAAEARESALRESSLFHERALGEMKVVLGRKLQHALEDKERSETYFGTRLSLADEKVVHYQDRTTQLEEKLEIAKSAAAAAIQAAQSRNVTTSPAPAQDSQPVTKATAIPEKISPQALRESILVLQEQLQEREARIEQVESELASIDIKAPAKLKDAEFENTWLRELLGVRIDDLEDIITTLSQPLYDREAVKDAAIRLKASLQMEQQEKERALAGGQAFSSLTSISNLAASPKALPLAAAAAWGNWRKGRETGFGSLGAMANGSVQQTPSKSSSPQSFFAGLMTPPSTELRSTPPIPGNSRPTSSSAGKRPLRGPSNPRQSFGSQDPPRLRQEPVTPPLMRKASYDLDAAETTGFGDEGVEGNKMMGEDEEPFGPRLGGIVGTM